MAIGRFRTSLLATALVLPVPGLTDLNQYTNTETGPDKLALGYPVPIPADSQLPVDGFRSYESLHARHQDLMLTSDLMTGSVVGMTRKGREVWAYHLSDADNTTAEGTVREGAFVLNGGIHAREWQSPEAVTGIIERLMANQDDQGFYQYLLENTNIIILPVLNVDGFLQTQRFPDRVMETTFPDDPPDWPRDGRMRRKNLLGADEELTTEGDNLFGVDLNRNNNPWWATNPARSSSDNRSLVHHGSAPASEPETRALQATAELGPESRLRFYTDYHSFSKIYFASLTGNNRRDTITGSLANRMRAVNAFSYAYGPAPAGGGIGSTDEYFAEAYQIPSYTLEIEPANGASEYGGFGVSHDGFILPESEIARVRRELADAAALGFYIMAGPAAVKAVEIRERDSGDVIFAGEWQVNNASSRSFVTTADGLLANDTDYQLWVAFNKPMRWRNPGGAVSNFPGQTHALAPNVSLEGLTAGGTPFDINLGGGRWLNEPGGAPDGFLKYQDDAFTVDFNIAGSTALSTATLVQLKFNNVDLAMQRQDAGPATVVDWNDGHWSNYESNDGSLADAGGIDRAVRIVDDGSPGFQAPGTVAPPTSPSSSGSGGGGGVLIWGLPLLIAIRIFRRY